MIKTLQRLFCMLVVACTVTSNALAVTISDSAEIIEASNSWQVLFDVDSYEIDLNFGSNRLMLRNIINTLESIEADENTELEGVRILGYSSPDGAIDYNERLSLYRAESVRDYIIANSSISSNHFETKAMGENWDELVEILEESDWSRAAEVINIINQTPSGQDPELEIKRIAGNSVYSELQNTFFKQLRSAASFEAFSLTPEPAPEPTPAPAPAPEPEPIVEPTPEPEPVVEVVDQGKNFRLGISTNLLYWAAMVTPNLELEVYIGDRYSIAATGVHRWRDEITAITDDMSVWSATGEVRRWFKGDNLFEGWYAGVYGRYGEYDILLPEIIEEDEYYRQGENYGGGITIGYTQKILRNSPLYLDLGISAGYDRLIYDKYYIYEDTYETCNAFVGHIERDSFGLKRVKVSILWRF